MFSCFTPDFQCEEPFSILHAACSVTARTKLHQRRDDVCGQPARAKFLDSLGAAAPARLARLRRAPSPATARPTPALPGPLLAGRAMRRALTPAGRSNEKRPRDHVRFLSGL